MPQQPERSCATRTNGKEPCKRAKHCDGRSTTNSPACDSNAVVSGMQAANSEVRTARKNLKSASSNLTPRELTSSKRQAPIDSVSLNKHPTPQPNHPPQLSATQCNSVHLEEGQHLDADGQ